MKIKTYPGRAVEADESLDKHGSMGLLYEANWMNANERIRQTPSIAYSKSNVNISSLGKYQNHLEQIKAFEADHKGETRTLRDFHGYKPSTLKIKKNLKHYNEWDNEPKTNDVIHNPLYNHAQNNWHSSDYLTNISNKRTDPKLRRSQTVIVKQPTSSASGHFDATTQGEIDLRDFYRRRHQLRQLEEKHQNKYPNALSVHFDRAASNCIDGNGIQKNCDSVSDNNSLYRDSGNLIIRNNNHSVNNASTNRMNCYKTLNFYAQNKNIAVIGENGENEMNGNGKASAKILLNPLARNKSIKINHFDMVTTAKEPQKLGPEEIDGQLCDTNGKTGKKVKKNSFVRMFATISAGSKFPRVFLGRSAKNQRAKLNLEELSENAESQQSKSSSSISTLSSSSMFSPSPPMIPERGSVDTSRKHNSAASSDSDSFVIPRPRLIVPVHTYARKRRTGNLVSDQSINNSKTSHCDRNKGKPFLHHLR